MQKTHLVGARTHNLRSVSLDLTEGELVCLTGVSGSGKSSLAVDTLYAEGQRRFVESFSPYARQFLERLERPPMDELDPVPAAIAVDRRAPVKSSRSTVATMADLEAYLSALFTREAIPVCPACGVEAKLTDARTAALTTSRAIAERAETVAVVTYPVRVFGTAEFLEVRERLVADGYRRLWIGGRVEDLDDVRPSEALAAGGTVEVVVDRFRSRGVDPRRLGEAIERAWQRGEGAATVMAGDAVHRIPMGLACPGCARTFEPARPGLFSYQSPVGACATCRGFGRTIGIDWHKVIPDEDVSLAKGAIRPWSGASTKWERKVLAKFCARSDIPMTVPYKNLTAKQRAAVIAGEGTWQGGKYPGVRAWFAWLETRTYKMHVRVLLARYRAYDPCIACGGKRLNEKALGYRVGGLDLGAWHSLEITDVRRRLAALAIMTAQGELVQRELGGRLDYLERVGLGYLTLDRQARTLSGGEAQRVSLTAALGSSLTGALFVIDEPTVGLHPVDVPPLTTAMRELAGRANVALVIEHDPLVVRAADRVVELGPGAGADGGTIVFDGTPKELEKSRSSPTGRALAAATASVTATAAAGRASRKPTSFVEVRGARANNLKNLTVRLPLGVMCAVTGPSGSGKSTLVEQIVYRALARATGERTVELPSDHDKIVGAEPIKRVALVDQSPLGRTSRGNAATYTKAWDRLRVRFAAEPMATARGLTAKHFSFNVDGGRCETCSGEGSETIEMQFLADVALICPVCRGERFKQEVLEVRHQGWTVAETLKKTVGEVLDRFANDPTIVRHLGPLRALGLGYLPLGQPLATLSGGEAQRLKLARTLSEPLAGTLFLLDEPSAGLHPADVEHVIAALDGLVRGGASVIVVDHDVDVMRAADWIVDLGPGGGSNGGTLVAEGAPAAVMRGDGATARAMRGEIGSEKATSNGASRSVNGANGTAPRVFSGTSAASAEPGTSKGARADVAISSIDSRVITVVNAREHNLRQVSCSIPRGKLVVVTGPSGSGKSTLAFDVVFAEGQRRFLETLTPYARQFLPTMPRPDVDRVTGVPPAIALEQRTSRAGGASTVATVTEVAHYLRLLFAKLGVAYCPTCDVPIAAIGEDRIWNEVKRARGHVEVLAPVVRARKGTYLDVFTLAAREGIVLAWVDGAIATTDDPPRLAKSKEHDIDLVIYGGPAQDIERVAISSALAWGKGSLKMRSAKGVETLYSTLRSCPSCGKAVPELDPRFFSFNTKQGKCDACGGTGIKGGEEALLEGETAPCTSCKGSRLAPVPRSVRLEGMRYHEVTALPVSRALERARSWDFVGDRGKIAEAPLAELVRRLAFLDEVGLAYLSLDRAASTLSGGEMQRLRLSAQLGSGLTGALYVLDEPTIGLHPRDTARLLANLRALVDTGSTVLVVEHDADTIRAADYLLDLGPAGGRNGGRLVAVGTPAEVLRNPASPTGVALSSGILLEARPKELDRGAAAKLAAPNGLRGAKSTALKLPFFIEIKGARAHNLKNVTFRVPVGRMTVVSGVSGSGKSTLVRKVFYPALRRALGLVAEEPGPHDKIIGANAVTRALAVDQSPIGRTPRSIPATFLGLWDQIRKMFAGLPESKMRGFGPGRFSFNTSTGGRCTTCEGQGVIWHEMSFLPDVVTPCEACGGSRFDAATLEIRYLGLTIGEVLRLTAEEAADAFRVHPTIARPLTTLCDLGVGYLQLGQGSNTLSGGEAQRLKLAAELTATVRHEPTVYVLDEPTTGLHIGDVTRLVTVLARLVDRGDTLVVIEHHPSVIAAADHVIELGPEGGDAGGRIVAEGAPRVVATRATATGKVLAGLFADASAESVTSVG